MSDSVLREALFRLDQLHHFDRYWTLLQSEWLLQERDLLITIEKEALWNALALPTRLKLEIQSVLTERALALKSQSQKPSSRSVVDLKNDSHDIVHLSSINEHKDVGDTAVCSPCLPLAERILDDQQETSFLAADDQNSPNTSGDWRLYYSEEHDAYYYFNAVTQESQWAPAAAAVDNDNGEDNSNSSIDKNGDSNYHKEGDEEAVGHAHVAASIDDCDSDSRNLLYFDGKDNDDNNKADVVIATPTISGEEEEEEEEKVDPDDLLDDHYDNDDDDGYEEDEEEEGEDEEEEGEEFFVFSDEGLAVERYRIPRHPHPATSTTVQSSDHHDDNNVSNNSNSNRPRKGSYHDHPDHLYRSLDLGCPHRSPSPVAVPILEEDDSNIPRGSPELTVVDSLDRRRPSPAAASRRKKGRAGGLFKLNLFGRRNQPAAVPFSSSLSLSSSATPLAPITCPFREREGVEGEGEDFGRLIMPSSPSAPPLTTTANDDGDGPLLVERDFERLQCEQELSSLQALMDMGFDRFAAEEALSAAAGDFPLATSYLLEDSSLHQPPQRHHLF